MGRAQDVRTDTLICCPRGCAYRRRLHAWLATGAVVPERVLEFSSYHAIVACVAAGIGIARVPHLVLETVHTRDGIAGYPLPEASARRTTSLVWHPRERSPALQAFQHEVLGSL
jgi:DNA-binding transcriptional LysR family regulator